MSVRTTRLENLIAALAILQGLHFFAGPFLYPLLMVTEPMPVHTMGIVVLLGSLTLIGGAMAFYGKPWAFWLVFASFLMQSVEYSSESFYASLMGPITVKFGFGWASPPSQLNFNLLAILVGVVAVRSARRLEKAIREAQFAEAMSLNAASTQLTASMSIDTSTGLEHHHATIVKDAEGYRIKVDAERESLHDTVLDERKDTMSEIADVLATKTAFRLADFKV